MIYQDNDNLLRSHDPKFNINKHAFATMFRRYELIRGYAPGSRPNPAATLILRPNGPYKRIPYEIAYGRDRVKSTMITKR